MIEGIGGQTSNQPTKTFNVTAFPIPPVNSAPPIPAVAENHPSLTTLSPSNANDCEGTNNGRGCLYLTGGLIQESRGAVGLLSGEGFIKRYSYDRCSVSTPPPYFPTTGRFLDNRYYEIDPVRFNVGALFAGLTPGP